MTSDTSHTGSEQQHSVGYKRAIQLLHDCRTEHGFLATPTELDNYRRVWGRDSSIVGLASLLTDDEELIETCRQSLETLIAYQGPHGEIPSNVDPQTQRVSYGGTAGRVDADLWFVICCLEYWQFTEDEEFLRSMLDPLEKVRFLLGAWEFNTRGLIYTPPTGDWADEYLQSGYVLYDQLLYYRALTLFCEMHRHLHGTDDHELHARTVRLKHLIAANYWFDHNGEIPDDIYHEVLFENGKKAAPHRHGSYWMPFFSPFGYGYRFDGMANSLVMLLGVASEEQCELVDRYIDEQIVQKEVMLLPAFDPVVTPKDEAWQELQTTYSHTFKNNPYEYHNGGLWPLVTGFYCASLARRGKHQLARQYRDGIHQANLGSSDSDCTFPEFLNGKTHEPGGTHPMAWSGAASVIAEQSILGRQLFSKCGMASHETSV